MKNTRELKHYIIKQVDPKRVYKDTLQLDWPGDTKNITIKCPFHEDDTPSLWISIDGKFKCMSAGCGARGNSIVNFYEQLKKLEFSKTLKVLYQQYVHPIIPMPLIIKRSRMLLDSPNALQYLKKQRLLKTSTIADRYLGFDGDRIGIPIFDAFGFVVNIRRYDFLKRFKGKLKMISYQEGYGDARIYPLDVILSPLCKTIMLVEGEWKALLAAQYGYHAVTITGGAGSWTDAALNYFKGKSVRIIYDVNDDKNTGQVGAFRVAARLAPVTKEVKIIELPLKEKGAGIDDWFKQGYGREELDELIQNTKPFETTDKKSPPGSKKSRHITVRLDEASQAKYYCIPLEMTCLVAGKDLAPYLVPQRLKLKIIDEKVGTIEETVEISTTDAKILRLIACSDTQLKGAIKEIFDVPTRAKTIIEPLETCNVEELRVIPAVDFETGSGKYVVRTAYFVGHGIEANRTYTLRGFTVPDPKTQHAVHLVTEAIPAQDNIDMFKITPDIHKRLQRSFQLRKGVESKFAELADWLSRHVTKIKQRPDLHIAVDLVYHSPLSFTFNGELVPKGWMELLVIGDTRCGKGFVTERYCRFVQLGEVVSGENCSFPGMVGGLQQSGSNRWMITWGKIPLNDRRLVVIDEVSAIPEEDLGRMSRVRSEGIAEITKIQNEKTRARTRLIWLSNTRSGKGINTYNSGAEAIMELMGATEDVSRFDLAVTVAANEVPSHIINAPANHDVGDGDRYKAADFKNLILWTWSRTPEQITFTKKATKLILELSIQMGRRYSPSIPLIQAENVRVKLAKISAAVAARVFSTDKSGEKLIVGRKHVKFAHKFIRQCYHKPSMGYYAFSQTDIDRHSIKDEDTVKKIIMDLGKYQRDFIEGMLEQHQITVTATSDYTNKDKYLAKELIGKLVRLRCLVQEYSYYVKRPAFINLLRQMRSEISMGDQSGT